MDEDGILPHLDVQQRDFENWVGKLDGIKEVLEPYYSNPQAARLVLEKFLQGNIQKAPPFIATMISGGRVEEIINIGTVSNLIIKLVLPPTPVFLKQLPPAIPNFTGRLEEQKKLVDEITRPITPGDQPRILSLVGMGGVGKSSLAIQVAHQVKGYFPDGQLYVDLHGAPGSQPLTPEDVLGGFLRAMGVEDRHIPRNLQLRASNFRSILDGKQVLIVLDNARDEAQIRPLRPSNPNCVVLVTSRKSLTALSCTTEIHLDVLPVAEGIALLEKLVDDDRVTAERGSAEEIVFLVGQLPLAIRIAGGKLKSRRRLTLKEYAADLAIHRGDLQHLQLADLDVRTCIDISYQDLKPELARLFRFLGLLAGVSFTPEVAAVLIDVEPNLICEKLEDLEDINLLEWAGENRYRFHDLVRAFAREKVANDPINEQQAARERAMRWYLKTSAEKNELLQAMVYKKGATVEVAKLGYSRADGGQNLDEVLSWFEAERKIC